MREFSQRELFARDTVKLFQFIDIKGYGWTYGEAYRTEEQQAIYLASGRSKADISQHQKRMAIDLHIWSIENSSVYITDNEWREIGEFWELLHVNNRFGGRFGLLPNEYNTKMGWDKFHFERKGN